MYQHEPCTMHMHIQLSYKGMHTLYAIYAQCMITCTIRKPAETTCLFFIYFLFLILIVVVACTISDILREQRSSPAMAMRPTQRRTIGRTDRRTHRQSTTPEGHTVEGAQEDVHFAGHTKPSAVAVSHAFHHTRSIAQYCLLFSSL